MVTMLYIISVQSSSVTQLCLTLRPHGPQHARIYYIPISNLFYTQKFVPFDLFHPFYPFPTAYF